MPLDRRAFLASLAAGLAAPRILRAGPARKKRYPIAFSTLGCPAWSWGTILEQADQLGYSALELRGIAGEMDLVKVPELSGTRLADTRRELDGRGLVVSDLGASTHMHEKDAAAREKQYDDGRRFIDLAHAMGVKYVRMFGNDARPGAAGGRGACAGDDPGLGRLRCPRPRSARQSAADGGRLRLGHRTSSATLADRVCGGPDRLDSRGRI